MSGQANVDIVQRIYDAVGNGDIPAPFAGTRRGREGVAEFFSLLGENLEFEEFEPREFVAQGDTVVVLGYERNLIKPTDRTFEQEWAHVFTLRDGKIIKHWSFEDTAAYVAAFEPS